jgi:outer membrane assembly lipoprotein YfiO
LNIYSFDDSEPSLLKQAQKQYHSYQYDDAIHTLDTYERLYPLSQKINLVDKLLLEAYYRSDDFPMLKAGADRFIYENPQDPDIDYISYLQIVSLVEQAKGYPMRWLPIDRSQRDVTAFKEAFFAGKAFLSNYPDSAYAPAVAHMLPELKEMIARYYMWRGNDLFSRKQYIGAAQAYQVVLDDFADTSCAPMAQESLDKFHDSFELVLHREFDESSTAK